jgi:hypothetical protein
MFKANTRNQLQCDLNYFKNNSLYRLTFRKEFSTFFYVGCRTEEGSARAEVGVGGLEE